jgi:uncharacterized membrane protein YphA (DoxX/SURF4 family)
MVNIMPNTKFIEWVLRIAVAGEFIGHGIFALQGKPQWIEWFSVFGITFELQNSPFHIKYKQLREELFI